MAETIKVRREGQIVKVLLNRPEAYNALDPELIRSFTAHMVYWPKTSRCAAS